MGKGRHYRYDEQEKIIQSLQCSLSLPEAVKLRGGPSLRTVRRWIARRGWFWRCYKDFGQS
jgi:hypothetical protein